MKGIVKMLLILVAIGGTTELSAQGWLKKLGKKAEEAAKNAVERNVERKTEEAVNKVFEGDLGKGDKNSNNQSNNNANEVYDNGDATAQSGKQSGQSLEMAYAKSDFVPGDEIIFEDLL
ncbi:MAG: OmpA family protein, partial [Parabacteroides sp.]|nr:OmpA family protein [Parabacteroides sp.]